MSGDNTEWQHSRMGLHLSVFCHLVFRQHWSTLGPAIRIYVDDLRQVRNDIAHISETELTDADFQAYVGRVLSAFSSLGLPINDIEDIKNQTSFPTEEVENLKKQVRDLQTELDQTKNTLQKTEEALISAKE